MSVSSASWRTSAACSSCRCSRVPLSTVEPSEWLSVAIRSASELISSTVRDDAPIGVYAGLDEATRGLAERRRKRLCLLQHVAPRDRRRRIVGEPREAVEELVEARIDRASRGAERRFDVGERFGERRFALRAADLALEPAFEEPIALRPQPEDLDATSRAPHGFGRHRAEIDDAARVARRVDVGDVLSGDVEAVALRLECAGGRRE